jgi:lysyl-tRNA synthetase, class II
VSLIEEPGLLRGRPEPPDRDEVPTASSRPSDDRWPARCATLTMTFAAVVVTVAVVEPWRDYMERANDPISSLTIPIVPNLVYAALLVALAVALRRRLRAAWWLLLLWWFVVPGIARMVDLVRGGTVTEVIGLVATGCAIIIMLRTRWQFTARHTPGSVVRAARIFLGGGVAVLAIGSWLVTVFGNTKVPVNAVAYTLSELLSDLGSNFLVPQVHAPFLVHLLIEVLGAGVFLWGTAVLFRPPRDQTSPTIEDEARLRAMVRDFGEHDSLGYFATRRDKMTDWDTGDPATARAGVCYRVVGSISLASGNPVGDPQYWDRAIAHWRDNARSRGLSIAVLGAGEAGATAYVKAGLAALNIGDEAILDPALSDPDGIGKRATHQAASRLLARGYSTTVVRHEALSPSEFEALRDAARAWRGDGGDERGFSMALGRLGDPLDGECLLVRAQDPRGRVRGFLSFVPWGKDGLSLDLMRRDPTADNGLVELMVTALVASAKGGRVSLNFAMFREAFERGAELGAGPMARLWRRALLLASRTWQLESLYRSNAKYEPQWQPRYICYEYASDLTRVATAAGSVEGFMSRPSLRRLSAQRASSCAETLVGSSQAHADQVRALIPPPVDAREDVVPCRVPPEQVRVRAAKVDRLRGQGIDPYPATCARTHTLAQVRAEAAPLESNTRTGCQVAVVGRVMSKRDLGRVGFARLRDGSGDLQVMVEAGEISAPGLELWRHAVDLGDQIAVSGEVVTTRLGELSVRADSIIMLSKSLRAMHDRRSGLAEPDGQIGQRYGDLIVSPRAREIVEARAAIVRSLRESLHARGFLEVETPALQRVATELHLKSVVIGGIERVFEIGDQLRNEGADCRHNQEFSSLAAYQAYRDYRDMRILTQDLIQAAATAVWGSPVARHTASDGTTRDYDLSGDWPVKSVCDAVSEAVGEPVTAETSRPTLHCLVERLGLEVDPASTWGALLEAIYEVSRRSTTTPVFFTDFPTETTPSARPHRGDPRLAEKCALVMFGTELATAYSELTDPVEQRRRLVAKSLLAAGDAEATQVDVNLLQALEYGMPPTGGMGLGIDRLAMSLVGVGSRDTVLFPNVRPSR